MSPWHRVLIPLLCARLVGASWGQTASSSLEYLAQGIVAYEWGQWEECAESLERALAQGFDDPLYRLEKRGYVESCLSQPTPERGGRSKRIFRIRGKGREALHSHKEVRDRLWQKVSQKA